MFVYYLTFHCLIFFIYYITFVSSYVFENNGSIKHIFLPDMHASRSTKFSCEYQLTSAPNLNKSLNRVRIMWLFGLPNCIRSSSGDWPLRRIISWSTSARSYSCHDRDDKTFQRVNRKRKNPTRHPLVEWRINWYILFYLCSCLDKIKSCHIVMA